MALANNNGSSSALFLPSFLCSTPALSPVSPNSTFPDLVSPCLASVLVPSVPALFSLLSLLSLCLYPKVFGAVDGLAIRKLPINRLVILKTTLALLDLLFSVFHFLSAFIRLQPLPSSPVPEQHIGPGIDLVFSLISLAAYARCVQAGFITSGSLHFVWFLRLLSLLPSSILLFLSNTIFSSRLFSFLHLPVALLLVFLFCWSDSSASSSDYHRLPPHSSATIPAKEVCPESWASAMSALTYAYASKMVWMGLRGTVTYEDLWELQRERQAETLRSRFYAGPGPHPKGTRKPITVVSFLWRLFLCTWEWLLTGSLLAIITVLGRYTNATFLRLIVDSVSAHHPLWLSMVALGTLFFVDFGAKVFTCRRDFCAFMAQTNLRSILSCAIFDKMLKLSASARGRYSAGEIVNLLSTDVIRIRFFWHQLRDFVYCPFMIAISFAGLWAEIGVNTLYGIGILVAVLPLNYVMSKLSNHYEQLQMTYKDARMKLVTDVLSGMKVLKLYAWEESMQRRIFELRRKEVRTLRVIFLLDACITVSFQLAPLIATLVSFFGYTILQHQPMRPDVAFVSMLFFGMLRYSIYQVPQLLAYSIRALVSIRRIVRFLNEDEQQTNQIVRESVRKRKIPAQQPRGDAEGLVVSLRNCSFTWSNANLANPTLHLRDISLSVEAGKLIGIVGRVGTGKSSLLSAILGEMECVQSDERIVRARSVGYVPQQPWIQNKTLKANVLFDSPFNEAKYRRVLEACALEADLKLLPAGDMTEIGEKGINLSGGQKARVALARAVYMDSDLYILDDTLSAVDAHVGAHIFERVIGNRGLLADKTRLFALNSLSFLAFCDRIVVMHDGQIDSIGTLHQLKQHREGPFAELMKEYMERHVERQRSHRDGTAKDDEHPQAENTQQDFELEQLLQQLSGSPLSVSLLEHRRRLESIPGCPPPTTTTRTAPISQSLPSGHGAPLAVPTEYYEAPPQLRLRLASHSSVLSDTSTFITTQQPNQQQQEFVQPQLGSELIGRLTEEEELCTGMVSRRVYLDYARAFGIWLSASFMLCLFLGSSTFEGLSNVWLARWSSSDVTSPEESAWNLGIYGAFNAVYVISTGVSSVIVAVGAYCASTAFHDQLVRSLFRSPMAFFDRTPMGRILNRLSADIERIDENIPWAVGGAMTIFAEAINSLISICLVIPPLVAVVLPLLIIFLLITHFYNVSSVQFRRLSSKCWSSVCSFVQDAYTGSDSIRVFNAVDRFRDRGCRLADFTNESFTIEIFTNRWLQVRLDLISNLAVFVCVMVAILMASRGVISLGALAMVIGCGYTFTGYLGEVARVWRESEVQMVCIERVGEYIRNPAEAPWRVHPPTVAKEWPARGHIQFRHLCLRYRQDAELVLRDLSFEVAAGEKVGIVGRTGAGKSSLTLALFRLVEPASGQILIDSVDITTVGLHDLRQALTIIPQDPVLFCGSLRINLDPFDEYTDSQIWEALEKAHLKETVSGLDGQLAYQVAEGGSNLRSDHGQGSLIRGWRLVIEG